MFARPPYTLKAIIPTNNGFTFTFADDSKNEWTHNSNYNTPDEAHSFATNFIIHWNNRACFTSA